ncbi:hypothetical protein FRC03_010952 [Tulasnella sp. 419]|nr:hypothetical protein FRC03_010952 [Tulasnella sp. 419]
MPVRLPVSLVMDRIKRGTALQLLTAVRKKTDPPGGTFISALDDHILSLDPVSSFENETSTLHRGDVIEIQGPAASGKTQLLYFLAVTCIVPHSINVELNVREISSQAERGKDKREVNLGGRGKSVIILDCDGRWRMKRLYTLLHSYLTSYFENAFDPPSPAQGGSGANALAYDFTPSIESVAQKCLSLIHIFKPKTSLEVATTLLGIPSYHRDHMPNQEILMLFIDSMSAFHHDDKRRIEQAGYADRNSNGSTKRVDSPQLKMMKHTLDAIQNLRTSLGVVTFLTNWALIGLDGKYSNNANFQNRAQRHRWS